MKRMLVTTKWMLGAVALLASCAAPELPHYAAGQSVDPVADLNGWYQFAGLNFKGALNNGKPDGIGYCRSDYDLNGYRETKESPCEFVNGERIDELHKLRMNRVAINVKQTQDKERREREEAESRRIQEANEAAREFDAGMRANLSNFQRELNDFSRKDRAIAIQTQQLADNAIRQKQEREEELATRELTTRASATTNQSSSSSSSYRQAKGEGSAEQRDNKVNNRSGIVLTATTPAPETNPTMGSSLNRKSGIANIEISQVDLSRMKKDFQLHAIKCLGTYYVTGNVPTVKGLSCYNMAYEAICPKGQTITGEATNLRAGKSSSCANMEYVYQLYPTPSCSVKELNVRVTDVQPGCK